MEGLQLIYDSRGLYLWLGLLLITLLLAVWVANLQARLGRNPTRRRRRLRGSLGGDFDEPPDSQGFDDVAQKLNDLVGQAAQIEGSVEGCLQRVGVVRFNPFSDVGGDQSFSLALLDARGDGLVLSSLYGRRESRVYVKPVERGSSKHALSDEEEEAIRRAQEKRLSKRIR